MAEIMNEESKVTVNEHIPSNAKTNTALALGIVGTALGALGSGCGVGVLGRMFGGNCGNGYGRNGWNNNNYFDRHLENDVTYIERKECADRLDMTRHYYMNRVSDLATNHLAMDAAKDREITADFNLYKYTRDSNDVLKQAQIDADFNLYKYTRDSNDMIMAKVAEVDKKVDIMSAVRPYQDALIDAKIDRNAILADYNLSKRTCRMIEGQLVLPNDPTVTGFGSYYTCNCNK